jgi:hypothetical protein
MREAHSLLPRRRESAGRRLLLIQYTRPLPEPAKISDLNFSRHSPAICKVRGRVHRSVGNCGVARNDRMSEYAERRETAYGLPIYPSW